MPLELDAEEIASLEGTTQIAGSAVRKLLEHYNQDVNARVHLELGTKEALRHRLDDIKNSHTASGKKHLIIIQVNSIEKGFHPGDQGHYVGLVIDKPAKAGVGAEPYKIQYIDPMSHGINPAIKGLIIGKIGVVEIEEYKGGIQYARVAGGEVTGNNHDCGAMLVYLITRVAHNQALPSLPLGGDRTYNSKQIGGDLRSLFKNDNNKGTKTDLEARLFGVITDDDHHEEDAVPTSTSAFRWQVEVQFKRLKDALLAISKERIREISRFIGKEVARLNKDGGYIHGIHQTLIEMIKDKMEEHIKDNVINGEQHREYLVRMAEVEGERTEERERLKKEELSGLDGHDRAIMEAELNSEDSEAEDSSNTGADDEDEENDNSEGSSNEEESGEGDDGSSTHSSGSDSEDKTSDAKEDAQVQVVRHYSNDMKGRLEKYIDDEADVVVSDWDGKEGLKEWHEGNEEEVIEAAEYREWATRILDSFGDLEDVLNLLDTFFGDEEGYSWFIHDLIMSRLDFGTDLLNEIDFVEGGITREEVELVLAAADLFIDWEENQVSDPLFIVKTLSKAFSKFRNGKGGDVDKVLEDLQERLLYYDDKEVSPECKKVEDKFNDAFARNDYVEAQRIWSIYTAYRRHLHDNKVMDEEGGDAISYSGSAAAKNSLTIKKRLDAALDRAELYEMRLYPHPRLKKLVYKDVDGVAEFNLGTLMGELEAVGKSIEQNRPIEGGQKRKNIFVSAFTFVVSAKLESGVFKREFVTVKLDLGYAARLLSKNPTDGVMAVGEDLTAIAREDIIRGYKVFATEADGIGAADAVTTGSAVNINTNINHSERVLMQAFRKQVNIERIVQLLREEVIKKFGDGYSNNYVVDTIALVGYSTNTVCDNCSPTLIYLQNSREEGGSLNLLAKELNRHVEGKIKFTTRGYNAERGEQDFSQFRMQTFVSAQVNFASQAHDMTDHHCGTKQPKPPKKTYNPKAKLILPEDVFGLHMAVKLDGGSYTLGQPYIVEFSGVDHSADYFPTGQHFPGVCFTSGGDSWHAAIPKGVLVPNVGVVARVAIKYHNELLNSDEGTGLLNLAQRTVGAEAVDLLLELGKDVSIAEQILSAANEQGATRVLTTLMGFDGQDLLPIEVGNIVSAVPTFQQHSQQLKLITDHTSADFDYANIGMQTISVLGVTTMKIVETRAALTYVLTEIIPIFARNTKAIENTNFMYSECPWIGAYLLGGLAFSLSFPGIENVPLLSKVLAPVSSTASYISRHLYHTEIKQKLLGDDYANNCMVNVIADAAFGGIGSLPFAIMTGNPTPVVYGALQGGVIGGLACASSYNNNYASNVVANIATVSGLIYYMGAASFSIADFQEVILSVHKVASAISIAALAHKTMKSVADMVVNTFSLEDNNEIKVDVMGDNEQEVV